MRYLTTAILSFFFLQSGIGNESTFQQILLSSKENDPSSIVANVSTIQGDYTEVEVDLTVAAPDSLVLSRFYSSGDTFDIAQFGGWRFHPHCYLSIQKDPKGKGYVVGDKRFERTLAYTGNPEGSILTYVGWYCSNDPSEKVLLKVDAEEECAGICNTAKGSISSWTNHKNNELFFDPTTDSFELHLCTKGKRFYQKSPSQDLYLLSHEILPSGNKLFYEYDDKGRLTRIKETNSAEEKTLAWIRIRYGDSVHVETSDGQIAKYHFEPGPSNVRILTRVERSYKPCVEYEYKLTENHALITKKSLPEERLVQIDYASEKSKHCKVQSVTIPLSDNETSSWFFSYGGLYTQVEGPGGRKSIYRFDDDFRLTAIEQFLEGSLYRVYKKNWGNGKDTGNLLSTSLEDSNGDIYHYKHFVYDAKGNIIEEREYGDIIGRGHVPLIIEDGHATNQRGHIKNISYFSGENTEGSFQTDAGGSGVKCWYKKGTNLLLKKLFVTKGAPETEDGDSGIYKRHIYEYDENASLINVTIDDGGIKGYWHGEFIPVPTEGRITKIFPKQNLPNLGAPEIIEERYFELEKDPVEEFRKSKCKKEALFKKTVNHFDSFGNIISQEFFDANEEHQYTLTKNYSDGLLISEADPVGNEIRYVYDENYNLILEEQSDTAISIAYTYDLQDHLTSTITKSSDGHSYETQNYYDTSGNVIEEIDRTGRKTRYFRDCLGHPIEIIYPEIMDGVGSLLTPKYNFCYDIFDKPVSITDPKGKVVSKSYNVKGMPTEIIHSDGSKEIFEYDSGGNLHKYLGRDGFTEQFSYDFLGRIIKYEHLRRELKTPFKKRIYKYNTFNKIYETNGYGEEINYAYDGYGRLVSQEKGDQKVDYIYDSLGRIYGIKKWKSSNSFTLEIKEYDLLDRIIEERIEDENRKVLFKRKYLYDQHGYLSQIIGYPQNKESVLFQYEYDGFGRLSKIENAVQEVTTLSYEDSYDEYGQKVEKHIISDPQGHVTEKLYDSDGNLLKITKKNKEGKILYESEKFYDYLGNDVIEKVNSYKITKSYTPGNQIETISYGNEITHQFKYNSYGDLLEKTIQGSDSRVKYEYENAGKVDSITLSKGSQESKYRFTHMLNLVAIDIDDSFKIVEGKDDYNRSISETIKDEFGIYQVRWSYDGEGKIQTLYLPDGSYVEYEYEGPFVKGAKRLDKDKKELYQYQISSRDQMGNILEEILPGNLGKRKQFWDNAGRKVEIQTDAFYDKVLKYNSLGSIKKREILFDDEKYLSEYDFSSLGELIAEKGEIEHTYSYDSVDNRVGHNSSSYQINQSNQITRAEGIFYSFDACGNLSSKKVGNKTWTFTSSPLNQITTIELPNEDVVHFTYAPNGKRLMKRTESKGKNSKILRYFYLGNTEIGAMDEDGEIVNLKIPSDPNNPESSCIAIEIQKEIYIPLYDLLGNITCLLDPKTNTIVESYRFSAYGEEEIIDSNGREISDSSIGNPWRYRGKRVDKEIDLIYFGYRYYDPQLGRWITPDPLGAIDGPNLYAYAQNNPIKYTDFFGLNSTTIDEDCNCTQHDHPGWHNAPEGCICICGKDGRVYFGRTGSTIKSSLGGISHGVVDFVVGSLHDLQTAAVHMGSGDIEMTFDERMQMLEAVEASQAGHMATVEGWMMDALSIDPSDSLYHSFRSKTTVGLEVGSLIVGGYGAVKGVIGFTRLARMPMQVSRITKNVKSSSLLKNKKIIQQIESFLGKDSRAFRNNYGDLLIESKDGLRQFRMDFKHPAPHKNPHSHLIEYEMRKNKKFEIFNQRIYPIDVIPE